MRKSLLKTFALGAVIAFTATTATAAVSWETLPGTYDFTSSMQLLNSELQDLVLGECEVTITPSKAIFNLAGNPNPNGQGLTLDETTGTLTINVPTFGDPNTSVYAFADAEGNNPYLGGRDDSFVFTWKWTVENDGTIVLPDFTIVQLNNFSESKGEILAKFSNAKLTPNSTVVEPEPGPAETAFAGTYTVSGTYYDYTENPVTGSAKTFTFQINNKNQVVEIAGYNLQNMIDQGYGIVGKIDGSTFAFPNGETLWLTFEPVYLVLGNGSYAGYETDGIALSLNEGEWELTDFSIWNYDYTKQGEEAFSRVGYWSNLSIEKTSSEAPVEPEPATSDFTGCYRITSSYVWDYSIGDYIDKTCLLSINKDNQVVKIADYDLQDLIDMGYAITGEIEGNSFTFTSAWGMYLTVGAQSMMLGNGAFSGVYGDTGIVLSEKDGEYSLTSFSIWSVDQSSYPDINYSPVEGWTNIDVEKLSDDPNYIPEDSGDEPGDEPGEGLPYLGVYTVKGTKITYTDGVAGNPEEVTFVMTIVEDEDGDYGITTFAGYDVPDDSWGYPGIYAWEGDEENIIEFKASGYTPLNEEGNLIMGGPSISDYEDEYVDIVFNTDDAGCITDFTVWSAEFDEWGDVISSTIVASWSNLTFFAGGTGAVESILDSNVPVEYYNLQGVKVQNPSKGLYIIRQGKTSKKVMVK